MAVAYFYLKQKAKAAMANENMLLVETHVSDLRIHKELDNHRIVVRGIFGVCDRPTANGRIYPRQIMEREIAKLQKKIEAGMLYGELDHPDTPKVELPHISHRITKLVIDDKGYIIGEAIVLNVPAGNIIKEILQTGGKVGISSRGIGTVDKIEEGKYVVNENYQLITFDFVSNPAVEDAVISEYDFAKINEALDNYPSSNLVVESETDEKIQEVLTENSEAAIKDEKVKEVFEYLGFKETLGKFEELINLNFDKIENTFKSISEGNDTLAAGLMALINETRNISNKLVAENTKLRRSNNRLQRANKQLQRENRVLQEKYEKLQDELRRFESLREEVEHLKQLLEEKEQELRARFQEYQLLVQEKQEQIDELLIENRSLRERVKDVEIENHSLREDNKEFFRWFVQTLSEAIEITNVNDVINTLIGESVDYQKVMTFINRAVLPRLKYKEERMVKEEKTAEERAVLESLLAEFRSLKEEVLAIVKNLSAKSQTSLEGVPRGKSRMDYLDALTSNLRYLNESEEGVDLSSVTNKLKESQLKSIDVPDGLTPEEYEAIKKLAGVRKPKK